MSETSSPPMRAEDQEQTSAVREKAQEVAGGAGEKAQEAAGSAQQKLREQLDQRSAKAAETVAGTAEDLRSVGEELRKQGKDTPAGIADRAAERTERLGTYLRESDADKMLADAEEFGRRQPLAVLVGGLVVGIAAARFLKASSHGRYRSRVASQEPTRELGAAQPPAAPVESPGDARREAPAVPVGPVTGR